MVLYTSQNAKLAFYSDAVRMGVLDYLAGQLNVIRIRKVATVDHDADIASGDAGFHDFQTFTMVQVKGNRDWAVSAKAFDGVAQRFGAARLFFQTAMHKISGSAQIGVGSFCSLQNCGRIQ